ncbi:hypothetical protein JCM10213_003022, partial [Rhodosporidiobolus nylandii]
IVNEDKDIGADILQGMKTEGELPASLGFRQPSAGPARTSRSSNNSASASASSSTSVDKKPYDRLPPDEKKEEFRYPCLICQLKGDHYYEQCPHIHENCAVDPVTKNISFKFADGIKKWLCRKFLQGRCNKPDCPFAHGCALCDAKHSPAECPKRQK